MSSLSRDEFEAGYAARSRMTVQELRASGYIVMPCSCGEGMCEGWKSIDRTTAAMHVRLGLYGLTADDLADAIAAADRCTVENVRFVTTPEP